jgi:hypothetical protein
MTKMVSIWLLHALSEGHCKCQLHNNEANVVTIIQFLQSVDLIARTGPLILRLSVPCCDHIKHPCRRLADNSFVDELLAPFDLHLAHTIACFPVRQLLWSPSLIGRFSEPNSCFTVAHRCSIHRAVGCALHSEQYDLRSCCSGRVACASGAVSCGWHCAGILMALRCFAMLCGTWRCLRCSSLLATLCGGQQLHHLGMLHG